IASHSLGVIVILSLCAPVLCRAVYNSDCSIFFTSALSRLGLLWRRWETVVLAISWACLSRGAFFLATFSLLFREATSLEYTSAAERDLSRPLIGMACLRAVLARAFSLFE